MIVTHARPPAGRPTRILGAGPAGLTAAITLAHAGQPVEVYERRADCGLRFRGDLQGIENWSSRVDVADTIRELGLASDVPWTPFHSAIHTNGRAEARHAYATPMFYLVRRGGGPGTLDTWLKTQALDAGVRIRFRETIAPAQADIVATGPDPHHPFAVDTGIVFRTDAPNMAVVLTTRDSAPRGYSYLLVAEGHGCLCTMLFHRFRDAPQAFVRARTVLLERYPVRIADPRPVGGVGYFLPHGVFAQGGRAVAGEASGLQDLLWGFGIRTALTSGHLAARSLLEGSAFEAEAASRYGPHLRAGVVNRVLWESLRWGNYRMLMWILRIGGRPLLRSFYGCNGLQRALYPAARALLNSRLAAMHPVHATP